MGLRRAWHAELKHFALLKIEFANPVMGDGQDRTFDDDDEDDDDG